MTWKDRIVKKVPPRVLHNLLLSFPFLYRTKFVNFECSLDEGGIQDLLEGVNITKQLPGDIVECGSNRCGTSVVLARYLKKNNIMKKIYALDSFAGFDLKELQREQEQGLTNVPSDEFTYTSYNYVLQKIKKLGLSKMLIPVNGYFQQTLPKIESNFCMAFIDCDLSESMTYAAETIWPKLVGNGILFFDDYGNERYQGAKISVDKFVKEHSNQIEQHGLSRRLYYLKKK